MAYWIHESGETIGPLRMVEVLERAQPETLVSQGQEWVRFDAHPDFGVHVPNDLTRPPSAANQVKHSGGRFQQKSTVEDGALDGFSGKSNKKKMSKSSSANSPHRNTRRSVFTLMAVSGLLLVSSVLIVWVVTGDSSLDLASKDVALGTNSVISTGLNGIIGGESLSSTSLEDRLSTIRSQGQAAMTSLRNLQGEFNALNQQYPTFSVFGKIIDRDEDSALIFGRAMPSNQDNSHLGTHLMEGNLLVVGAIEFRSSFVISQEGLYFVRKTTAQNQFGGTVPLRVYSTNAPPDQVEVERQYQRIRGQIKIVSTEIQTLNKETARVVAEIELRDWNAVKDDPLQLLAYAEKMMTRGDSEKARKALVRSCEIAPENVAAHIELGQYYFDHGQHEDAEAEYRAVLAIDPENSEIRGRLGLLLSQNGGDKFEAVANLQQSASEDANGIESSNIRSEIETASSKWGEEGRGLRLLIDSKLVTLNDALIESKYHPPYPSSGISAAKIPEFQAGVEKLKQKHRELEQKAKAVGFDLLTLELNSSGDTRYWKKRRELWSKLNREAQWARKRSQKFSTDSLASAEEKALWREEMCSQMDQEARTVGITLG